MSRNGFLSNNGFLSGTGVTQNPLITHWFPSRDARGGTKIEKGEGKGQGEGMERKRIGKNSYVV